MRAPRGDEEGPGVAGLVVLGCQEDDVPENRQQHAAYEDGAPRVEFDRVPGGQEHGDEGRQSMYDMVVLNSVSSRIPAALTSPTPC